MVSPEHARRVHPGGGVLRATATVDGVAVGTWSLSGGRVEIDLRAARTGARRRAGGRGRRRGALRG